MNDSLSMSNSLSLIKRDMDLFVSNGWDGALPQGMDAERFNRCGLTMIKQNPKLMKCDPRSIISALMTIAELGLMPEGELGQAYIVPYGNKAQAQVGYKGKQTLAYNVGIIIETQEVYANDEKFVVSFGTNGFIDHIPRISGDRGEFIASYAIATFPAGKQSFKVVSAEDGDQIRNKYSASYKYWKRTGHGDKPAWETAFPQMCSKSAVHALCKNIPLSLIQRAVALDEAHERGRVINIKDGNVIEAEPIEKNAKSSLNEPPVKTIPEALAKPMADLLPRVNEFINESSIPFDLFTNTESLASFISSNIESDTDVILANIGTIQFFDSLTAHINKQAKLDAEREDS